MTVLGQGVLDGKTIDAKKLVDRHCQHRLQGHAPALGPAQAAHGKFKG